jgi:ribosomal protein S12 methylthiotransferase
MDIYRQKSLARLLKELVSVCRNIEWIRLLYAFPAHVTDELIDVIAGEEKICKYIDMPLQHISDPILAGMNRGITKQGTIDLIRRLRSTIAGGFIRTTFIVGLPGETDADFQELRDFVQEFRFERVGVFVYSREEGTAAYGMPGQVPAATKRRRMKMLMEDQQKISRDIQAAFVGRTLKVLIEEKQEGSPATYLGRSEYDAPEVDGTVSVHSSRTLKPGDMVDVRITDAVEYDLTGEAV